MQLGCPRAVRTVDLDALFLCLQPSRLRAGEGSVQVTFGSQPGFTSWLTASCVLGAGSHPWPRPSVHGAGGRSTRRVSPTVLCRSQLTQALSGRFNSHVHVEYEWRLLHEDLDESDDDVDEKSQVCAHL